MTEWFSREDDSISGLCSPLAACLHNKGLTCIVNPVGTYYCQIQNELKLCMK